MSPVKVFRGNFRVSRLSSNSPDVPNGTIQVLVDAVGERDVADEKRLRIVIRMSPAAFATGLMGLCDLDDQCEIEIQNR